MSKIITEAATLKAKARGLIRDLDTMLGEKEVPKGLRDQIQNLKDNLNKTWADLADQAANESLQEASSVGSTLESNIHSNATYSFDSFFSQGVITREEWKILQNAAMVATDAFSVAVMQAAPKLYERLPWGTPDVADSSMMEDKPATESILSDQEFQGDVVPLSEAAIDRTGVSKIKIIAPGWGSSGYYSPEVLQRDGPKVFTKGLKMYWDHPTTTEEAQRPERSLKDLAGEFISDATYQENGKSGPGLYGDAKIFESYQKPVNELAPHIGVSIRALGKAENGQADGKKGPIISEISAARSVDFVTTAGAGGKVLGLFESARQQRATNPATEENMPAEKTDEMKAVEAQLAEAQKQLATFQEAKVLTEGRAVIVSTLSEVKDLPEMSRSRLTESVKPVVKDGALDAEATKIHAQEAAKAEMSYLAGLMKSGVITGMGGAEPQGPKPEVIQAQLEEGFKEMGMSEKAAKVAAQGR